MVKMIDYKTDFNGTDIPWVESPFFYDLLETKPLSEEEYNLAKHYHEEGYVILDLNLSEKFIKETILEVDNKVRSNSFKSQESGYHYSKHPRLFEAWKWSNHVLELTKNKKVLDTLKFLYKRNPLPFQIINFVGGAQQPLHSDTIHFSSIPQRWLGVSWIALEDVDEENGTLMYVPKSHKLPIFEFSNIGIEVPKYGEQFDAYSKYESFIKQMVESKGLEIKTFTAKKGQALIWSANLLHGSVPIADENRTRYSQATHYYFDGCSKYYSPMFSDTLRGNVSEKDLTEKDIINHEIKL